MPQVATSTRLAHVRYEIRGTLYERALALEAAGHEVLKLNIGNPGAFGFQVPAHVSEALREGVAASEGYCHQRGLPQAREAIRRQAIARGAGEVTLDDVFLGNGVSELIDLALRALLDPGDEVLVPAPDYPLWSASVVLNGGCAVHYPCAPEAGFLPDPDEVEALITPRTRALVLCSPSNPTGAVQPEAVVCELAQLGLPILSDEIYDGLLYDDARFEPVARHGQETVCLSFGGLSKVHRACGYRVGWMVLSGTVRRAGGLRHALDLLAALRLCSNVPGQWAVAPALAGGDTVSTLTQPGGRLYETRRAALEQAAANPLLSLEPPAGALYAFPRVDAKQIPGFDDNAFALELLEREHVLVVPGSSFNVPYGDHFRLTLLPEAPLMREAFARIGRVLEAMVEDRRLRVA